MNISKNSSYYIDILISVRTINEKNNNQDMKESASS
jgi:hypothetical protein